MASDMNAPTSHVLLLPLLIACVVAILLGTSAAAAMMAWPSSAAQAEPPAPAVADSPGLGCKECGVVASLRAIPSANSTATDQEITVRMKDGSNRIFVAAASANWRTGARVMLIE